MKKDKKAIVPAATASTTLALPSIQPKPNKTDIINAMTERAIVRMREENKERREARERAKKAIEEMALAEFKETPGTPRISVSSWGSDKHVELEFKVRSPRLTRMMEAYQKLLEPQHIDEAKIRRKIREQMTGPRTCAVQTLLENPEAVKALDASLAHIGM